MKYYNILKYFSLFIVLTSIIANLYLAILDRDLFAVICIRSLYLYALLVCYLKFTKWTLALLIVLNIVYWYLTLTMPNVSGYQNPITYFTIGLHSLNWHFKNPLNGSQIGIIMMIPGILNILITFIDIPYRILKLKKASC
jgi:hypothetical protein